MMLSVLGPTALIPVTPPEVIVESRELLLMANSILSPLA
jgi:hypothetical protein